MAKETDQIMMSKADLKELVSDINKEYKDKLDSAATEIERLKLTLERQEKLNDLTATKRDPNAPKIEVRHNPANFNPIDQHARLAKPYIQANKDKYYRYINSRSDQASSRRAQGFEPVKDAKGNEVRYHDSLLAEMPRRQFEEEIVKPVQDLRDHKRRSIKSDFEAVADREGIKTFGDVTYDKGDTNG